MGGTRDRDDGTGIPAGCLGSGLVGIPADGTLVVVGIHVEAFPFRIVGEDDLVVGNEPGLGKFLHHRLTHSVRLEPAAPGILFNGVDLATGIVGAPKRILERPEFHFPYSSHCSILVIRRLIVAARAANVTRKSTGDHTDGFTPATPKPARMPNLR